MIVLSVAICVLLLQLCAQVLNLSGNSRKVLTWTLSAHWLNTTTPWLCQHRWEFRFHWMYPPPWSSSWTEWSKPRVCLNPVTSFFVVHTCPGGLKSWPTSHQGNYFQWQLSVLARRCKENAVANAGAHKISSLYMFLLYSSVWRITFWDYFVDNVHL